MATKSISERGPVITFAVETFHVKEADGKGGKIVVGLAMPVGKTSRNRMNYIPQSVKECFKTLEGCSFLFNHNYDKAIGHVEGVTWDDKVGLSYKADIDPTAINQETGVTFARSFERGDIKKVSVSLLYDESRSYYDETTDTMFAYAVEFLEMSGVSVPGFEDTTIQVIESFKGKRSTMKPATEKSKVPRKAKEEAPKYHSIFIEEADDGMIVSSYNPQVKTVCKDVDECLASVKDILNTPTVDYDTVTLEALKKKKETFKAKEDDNAEPADEDEKENPADPDEKNDKDATDKYMDTLNELRAQIQDLSAQLADCVGRLDEMDTKSAKDKAEQEADTEKPEDPAKDDPEGEPPKDDKADKGDGDDKDPKEKGDDSTDKPDEKDPKDDKKDEEQLNTGCPKSDEELRKLLKEDKKAIVKESQQRQETKISSEALKEALQRM